MKKSLFVIISTMFAVSCSTNSSFFKSNTDDNPYCLLSFNTEGGSFIDSQKIIKGEKPSRPSKNPTKKDEAFVDWFVDSSASQKFNFDNPINEDTTVYARWTADTYDFKFEGINCTLREESKYSEKIKKQSENVSFTVIADEGHRFPNQSFPGCQFIPNESKDKASLIINKMDGNYNIEVYAHETKNAVISFEGTNCTVNEIKEGTILDKPTTDKCNYEFYIKPDSNFRVPLDKEVEIKNDSGESVSTDEISYHNGVITVKKLLRNINITATSVFTGYRINGVSNGVEFKVGDQENFVTYYDETVSKVEGPLVITYDPDTTGVDFDEDNIFVKENGVEKPYIHDELNNKITIDDVKGNITFNLIVGSESGEKVNVTFNEDLVDNYDIYYLNKLITFKDGSHSVSLTVPYVPEEKGYSNYEIFNFVPHEDADFLIRDFIVTKNETNEQLPIFTVMHYDDSSFLMNLHDDITISYDTVKMQQPRELQVLSFEHIAKICENRKVENYFYAGQTKKITLKENGIPQPFEHEIRIIGFNHDKLTEDTSKTASITFEFTNLLTKNDGSAITQAYTPSSGWDIKKGDYSKSLLKDFYEEFYDNNMPDDLKPLIKQVNKKCHRSSARESSEVTVKSHLFPLGLKEVNAKGTNGDYNEAPTYKWYEDHHSKNDHKRVTVNVDGADTPVSNDDHPNYYHLRTCGDSNNTDNLEFYYFNNDGELSTSSDSWKYGVCCAFSIC